MDQAINNDKTLSAQQQFFRLSYKKHKERLVDIRQNNINLKFYNLSKSKPEDKKKILQEKTKR
jgi:hypothetical protein